MTAQYPRMLSIAGSSNGLSLPGREPTSNEQTRSLLTQSCTYTGIPSTSASQSLTKPLPFWGTGSPSSAKSTVGQPQLHFATTRSQSICGKNLAASLTKLCSISHRTKSRSCWLRARLSGSLHGFVTLAMPNFRALLPQRPE